MSALGDLRRLFKGAGLAAPPIPPSFEPRLRELGPWVFATRDIDPMAMYLFQDYLDEVLTRPVEDYVAVSHAGHGVNSYSINYHLVYGPIAVFTQAGWAGAYGSADLSAVEVSRQLTLCGELIAAADAARDRLPSPQSRLIVAESDFRAASMCRWLDAPLTGDDSVAARGIRPRPTGRRIRTDRSRQQSDCSTTSPSPGGDLVTEATPTEPPTTG